MAAAQNDTEAGPAPGAGTRFVGAGERPQDLARFQPGEFVEALFAG